MRWLRLPMAGELSRVWRSQARLGSPLKEPSQARARFEPNPVGSKFPLSRVEHQISACELSSAWLGVEFKLELSRAHRGSAKPNAQVGLLELQQALREPLPTALTNLLRVVAANRKWKKNWINRDEFVHIHACTTFLTINILVPMISFKKIRSS